MKPIQTLLGSVSLAILASVAPGIAAPAAAASLPVGDTISLVATAYGPSLKDNYPYGPVDYYGNPLKPGDVAVDPSVIPLGTRLYVTGYKSSLLPAGGFYAIAVDTGGAIKGDRIDIYINAPDSQVSMFGIQDVTVTVVGANGQGGPTVGQQSTGGTSSSGQGTSTTSQSSSGTSTQQSTGGTSSSGQGTSTTSQSTGTSAQQSSGSSSGSQDKSGSTVSAKKHWRWWLGHRWHRWHRRFEHRWHR